MVKYFTLVYLLVFLAGCTDERSISTDGDEMNLSREEKIRIISEKGYSEDLEQAKEIATFLTDVDNEVVGQACFFLGYLGARDYIADIKKILKSDDQDLINLCVSGLALMLDARDEHLVEEILPLVNHEYLLVRMGVVEALGNIQSKKVLESLMRRFDREAPAVQYEIVRALGKIGDHEALPLLMSYLDVVEAMDHSVPRKGGTRGSDPHPDVLEVAVTEAIATIRK